MPITLSALVKDEAVCTVEFEGETFDVGYRPSAYTPNVENLFQSALEKKRPANAFADLLAMVMVWWDVLDDEGQRIPVTRDVLGGTQTALLTRISTTIVDDMNGKGEDRKNSAGGSPRKGSLANARNGTR